MPHRTKKEDATATYLMLTGRVLPSIGHAVEAKWRGMRWYDGTIVGWNHDGSSFSIEFKDGSIGENIPRINVRSKVGGACTPPHFAKGRRGRERINEIMGIFQQERRAAPSQSLAIRSDDAPEHIDGDENKTGSVGSEISDTDDESDQVKVNPFVAPLVEFYKEYAPGKADHAESILARFEGDEWKLYKSLLEKYGKGPDWESLWKEESETDSDNEPELGPSEIHKGVMYGAKLLSASSTGDLERVHRLLIDGVPSHWRNEDDDSDGSC